MFAPPPRIIATRYRVIKEIGRGGMGVVYLVKHENTGEYLAVKVLHEHALGGGETLERFRREMRLPAKIRSEHIARITDADVAPELGGAPFLVMELLSGCDLGQLLSKRGPRRPDEVAWLLGQIAKALDKAHSLDIVHRDLKPENLFVHIKDDGKFITKVLDFGIAKVKEDIRRTPSSSSSTRHANTQSVLGTPLYMSPEQARGPTPEYPTGPASDIWSMGMVTFELLTGEPYWQADSAIQVLSQIFFAPMQPPSIRSPVLTAKFDRWFERSCDRDAAKRWVSATKQLDMLLDALGLGEIPSEIPASLAQQVNDLTALHAEQFAQDEPSLYLKFASRHESSDETIKETALSAGKCASLQATQADSSRGPGPRPQAITGTPAEPGNEKKHMHQLLNEAKSKAPGGVPAAKDGGSIALSPTLRAQDLEPPTLKTGEENGRPPVTKPSDPQDSAPQDTHPPSIAKRTHHWIVLGIAVVIGLLLLALIVLRYANQPS